MVFSMQRYRAFGLSLFLLAAGVLVERPASAQNLSARQWFERGIRASDSQSKILAYQRAIAQDSLFVEAYYNLGMTYKRTGDLPNAIANLMRAYTVRPYDIDNDTKLKILYELGTTYRAVNQAAKSEEALRTAASLALQPSLRARIALELAGVLQQRHRYDEARVELEAVRDLEPSLQPRIEEQMRDIEAGLRLEELYKSAMMAKAGGKLADARALLVEIEGSAAGFRDAGAQIRLIDSLAQAETVRQQLELAYTQGRQHEEAGAWQLAQARYESIRRSGQPNYRDVEQRLREVRTRIRQQKLEQEMEQEYEAGRAAMAEADWPRAVIAFERVLEMWPQYKDARQLLRRARYEMDRISQESTVVQYYAEGLAARTRGDLTTALAAFAKVRSIDANYRDIQQLVLETEQALLDRQRQTEAAEPEFTDEQLDSLYQAGLDFLETQNWTQAAIALEKLHLLDPDYAHLDSLLGVARERIDFNSGSATTGRPDSFSGTMLGVMLVTALALPLLGFLVLAPASRARYYLMRGNFGAAAGIYERRLARNPGRLRLYPQLARIYLLANRSDAGAIDVYRKVLKLNIAGELTDRLNAIVTQNYLTSEQPGSEEDAIEILENALKDELKRRQQEEE